MSLLGRRIAFALPEGHFSMPQIIGEIEKMLLNVQQILSIRSFFLVPFGPAGKGDKQIFLARLDLLYETVLQALAERQLQPVYLEPCWLPH